MNVTQAELLDHSSNCESMIRRNAEYAFICCFCDYHTSTESLMKKHLRSHTGERPYKCPICGYGAMHSGTLKQHLQIHTRDKPYKCTICDYSSKRSYDLNRHIVLKHRGVQ